MRIVLLAGVTAVALAAAGCGPAKLDVAKIQSEIQNGIQSQTGLTVNSVSCPASIEVSKGNAFDCSADVKGLTQPIIVRVTQEDDSGNVKWAMAHSVESTDPVEAEIENGVLDQQGLRVTVDCPDKAIKKVGYKFQCDVSTGAGDTTTARVEVTSDDGDIDWEVG